VLLLLHSTSPTLEVKKVIELLLLLQLESDQLNLKSKLHFMMLMTHKLLLLLLLMAQFCAWKMISRNSQIRKTLWAAIKIAWQRQMRTRSQRDREENSQPAVSAPQASPVIIAAEH